MANPAHVAALKQGRDAFRVWRDQHRATVPDLSGADLTGEDLTAVNLEGCDLSSANLRNAILSSAQLLSARLEKTDLTGANCVGTTFSGSDLRSIKYEGAIFRGAVFHNVLTPHGLLRSTDCRQAYFRETDLSSADLSGRDFSRANFQSAKLVNAQLRETNLSGALFFGCELRGADMTGADCGGATFERATLTEASLRLANLRGSDFNRADLGGADISHADFYETILTDARMERVRGAPAARNLLTTRIERPVYYFESAILSPVDRWLDWETVRIAGRLPVFGASYSALIAIPFFFYLLEIYNDKIALVRSWAEQTVARDGAVDYHIANTVLERVHPLPVPALSELLLISTIFLASGATIYALACPSRVKEFSLDQWKYQLGLSAVHYLADAWRRRIWRVAALVFYVAGGAGAVIVLGSKLLSVAEFLLRNHAWSL
jgi:uncharacterized protein YjbI with pentapeptide repeats